MKLTTFKQYFLESGNKRQDQRVAFLIQQVGGNIDNFLDQKGNIDCKKIDHFVKENPSHFSPETLGEIQSTLGKVRAVYMHQSTLSQELDDCHSSDERLEVLRGYSKSLHMNSFLLVRILSGVDSLDKAKRIMTKYGKGVEVTYQIMNILFKLSIDLEQKKEILATYWSEKPCDIYMLNMMLAHAKSTQQYWDIISQYGEGLAHKGNLVTLLTFLKVLLRDSSEKSKNTAIETILELIQELPGNLNPRDYLSLEKAFQWAHGYRGFMLDTIRERRFTKLYFLLPEERSQ